MDLVRQMLLQLEAREETSLLKPQDLLVEGFSTVQVMHHLNLLFEAGFISGEPVKSTTSDRLIWVHPGDLTWSGYEFLDTVRDPEIWRKAKAGAAKAGSSSLAFIWEVAKTLLRRELSNRAGINL